jgi:hypothetical protein
MNVATTADILHRHVIWFFGLGPSARESLGAGADSPDVGAPRQAFGAYVCFVVTVLSC